MNKFKERVHVATLDAADDIVKIKYPEAIRYGSMMSYSYKYDNKVVAEVKMRTGRIGGWWMTLK